MRPPDALEPDQFRIRNSSAEKSCLLAGREGLACDSPFCTLRGVLPRFGSMLRFKIKLPLCPQQIPGTVTYIRTLFDISCGKNL